MGSRSLQSGSRDLSSFILLLAQPEQPCKIPAVPCGTFFLAFPTLDEFNSILAVATIEHSPILTCSTGSWEDLGSHPQHRPDSLLSH